MCNPRKASYYYAERHPARPPNPRGTRLSGFIIKAKKNGSYKSHQIYQKSMTNSLMISLRLFLYPFLCPDFVKGRFQ